ncbi:MAG: hypothetical protein J5865_03995, partial [Lachnospiraceae bacterium]|nr:hypothetical protein [Lachnospiraceae bacterium]
MKKRIAAIMIISALMLSGCGAETVQPSASASWPADTSAPETEGSKAAETTEPGAELSDQLRQAILDFCEMMFGSMRHDSTVTFGWDDFDSIEGYMVAKYCEARRDFYKIDQADITDVWVLSVELQGEPLEQEDSLIQCAVVSYEYVGGGVESKCLTRYFFTLREENGGFRVTDLTTYNSKYSIADTDDVDIAVLRESLELWKEECKDAGDKWQFEAVDRIMEQTKVPIDDLIPEEMKEEMRRRSQKTSEDAAVEDIRANAAYDLPEEAMGAGMTFREGDTEFWVSYTYLDCYDVYFSDNSIKTVGEALELGLIGLDELDRFEIPYVL